MKRAISLISLFMFAAVHALAQTNGDSLFDIKEPLKVQLNLAIKQVGKSKEDTIYISHLLYYWNSNGTYDSMKVGIKGLGNFRLQQCYFPPLWVMLEKKQSKKTLFEGNKKLKLVLPCIHTNSSNVLILREYLCYKLYEEVTPYAFKTRLVNIELTEQRGKNKKIYNQKGIFIEDPDKTAKRFDAKRVKDAELNSAELNDTSALRFDLFQFMISNTDWSKSFQHNCKLIYQKPNYIPIPYDFDMSGFVNAPYAVVSQIGNESLPIQSVKERYYRGDCRSKETTEYVRQEFLAKEEKFLSIPDELEEELSDKEINNIKKYLKEFFTILRNDKSFKNEVLNRCRQL
jgi:hypothetical protein